VRRLGDNLQLAYKYVYIDVLFLIYESDIILSLIRS
jgi:hypothetical protein